MKPPTSGAAAPTPVKARPTMYKGIKMRSRLEAGFAAWLDRRHFTWEYEPCAFATEQGQYLPDFRLSDVNVSWLPDPATVYVEVKPDSFANFVAKHANPLQAIDDQLLIAQQAGIIAASEPDALLVLMQPTGSFTLDWDDPNDEFRARLLYRISPMLLPGGRVGFARGLGFGGGPWAGEYWKPTSAEIERETT